MAIAKIDWPNSYYDALDLFRDNAGISQTNKPVKIGHNTDIVLLISGEIIARYHGNAIVSYSPGEYAVNNAGWNTVTTSGRLNAALNALFPNKFSVNIRNGSMFLTLRDLNNHRIEFPYNDWLKIPA